MQLLIVRNYLICANCILFISRILQGSFPYTNISVVNTLQIFSSI
jgi:hypothetical protein